MQDSIFSFYKVSFEIYFTLGMECFVSLTFGLCIFVLAPILSRSTIDISSSSSSFCVFSQINFRRDRKITTKEFYFLYIGTGLLSTIICIGAYLSFWPSTYGDMQEDYLRTLGDFWRDEMGNYPVYIASSFVRIFIEKIRIGSEPLD